VIGKPDPKCRWCKGTGQVPLFTSSCECDCAKVVFTDFLASDMKFLEKEYPHPLENHTFRYTKKYDGAIFDKLWKKQYPNPSDSQGVKK